MKNMMYVRGLLGLMGLYDGVLGVAFLVAAPQLFDWVQVTPPNHFGYVHFSAALLIVFALMFFAVAMKPRANRNLLPYCFLLKVSYCGVVFYHWLLGDGLPGLWKPFAIADLVMAALLAWMYVSVRTPAGNARREA